MAAHEWNFDGLVGPTHNYAGLSYGNVASAKHLGSTAHPKMAALQGLAKMRLLNAFGVPQAVLPPHERPHIAILRAAGFMGNDEQVIGRAAKDAPLLLAAAYSASAMWTANAATVSPSDDTVDGKVHFTPANLTANLHRSNEADFTTRLLRFIFNDRGHFKVHDALPGAAAFSDEGAANHTRLCAGSCQTPKMGIEIFTFGRVALSREHVAPQQFPARQTREACKAIARRHSLLHDRTLFIQQHPVAIDAGVFHNDVISVGHENVLLVHESAYVDQPRVLDDLRKQFAAATNDKLHIIEVSADKLPLEDAVASYLFNSQIVSLPSGDMRMVCPAECQERAAAKQVIGRIISEENPIKSASMIDLRQSMQNGGGPACLRLRIALNDKEADAIQGRIRFDDQLHDELEAWINTHYRDELHPDDLADPNLIRESRDALDALTRIMQLGDIYDFQR